MLLTLLLTLLCVTSSYAAVTQHWPLNDNAASTTVVATVGTNGSLVGGDNTSAKATTGPGGTITAALDLNGTDDYILINGSSISFASGAAWSLSAWVKLDGAETTCQIAGKHFDSNNRIFVQASGTLRCRINSTNSDFAIPALGTTNWHHILVTKTSGDSLRVFVDGTESSTGAVSNTATFAPTVIGGGVSGTIVHDGKIAQVKVFDTDESANVATLYAEGTGGGGGSAVPAIKYYYDLEQ